ncbi:hypothetical protein GCK72_024722 [Caenorhabditis remanei]|uniref:Uncharacterized protein n=1 Tax=Caenorhabditis remanei TaxID=31234 RepID=A0A6A5G0S4_CAERE|nr:hypothetical protein GCK72_024722 [Caenorhabditis remanei]KAF1748255.1 hypothetical protein GCK72_024722 [Caenorhabditis remanei]
MLNPSDHLEPPVHYLPVLGIVPVPTPQPENPNVGQQSNGRPGFWSRFFERIRQQICCRSRRVGNLSEAFALEDNRL